MKYVTISAKELPITPDFFNELSNRTKSKPIKQYIANVIKPYYLFDNKQVLKSIKSIKNTEKREEAKKSFLANSLKALVHDILIKKNQISDKKFLRDSNNTISYPMFPSNIFDGLNLKLFKQPILNLQKRFKREITKDSNLVKRINTKLQKDSKLRHLVKDTYSNYELLTRYILYKFKTLNVIDLEQDSIFTYNFSDEEKEQLKHTIDYLESLRTPKERVPDLNAFLKEKDKELAEKLSNLSFDDLQNEITNYNFTDNVKTLSLKQEIKNKDVKLIHKYNDKYCWVSILSKEGLEREGSNMNHCVGSNSVYSNGVKSGKTQIYSLRDEYNTPHITIEVTNNHLEQIQGYGNSTVSDKYYDYLFDGLKSKIKYKTFDDYYFTKNGIYPKDNELYTLYNLPDNFECDSDITIDSNKKFELKNLKCATLKIISCPNMIIKGNIVCNHLVLETEQSLFDILDNFKKFQYNKCDIKKYYVDVTKQDDLDSLRLCVPENIQNFIDVQRLEHKPIEIDNFDIKSIKNITKLTVPQLRNSMLTTLPDNFTIKGNFYIDETKLISLPENLTVDGSLYLGRKNKIVELPKGLTVKGDLSLEDTDITSIPSDLNVQGVLDLGNKITNLPDNFSIDGELVVSNSISELPEGLSVGSLLIINSNITRLPKKFKISENLIIRFSEITNLPNGLKLKGILILDDTKIEKLPDEIICFSGDLRGNITDLPKKFIVKQDLCISCPNLTKLPENLTVGNNLKLHNIKSIDIPKSIKVKRLSITYCNVSNLPDNIKYGSLILECSCKLPNVKEIEGNLDIKDTDITELPKTLKTIGGSLVLNDKVKKLNDNMTINGYLDLGNTNVSVLPKNLKVSHDLYLNKLITKLPEGLKVGGTLHIHSIKKYPDDLIVGYGHFGAFDSDDFYQMIKKAPELREMLLKNNIKKDI